MDNRDAHTVLLVDDNVAMRVTVSRALRRAGYRVEEVADGLEAFGRLQRGLRPCLIVLDLEMPIMSGDTFRRAQLARAELRDIPVLLFSSAPNLAQIAAKLAVAAYAPKSIEVETLLKLIEQHCDKRPRQAADVAAPP